MNLLSEIKKTLGLEPKKSHKRATKKTTSLQKTKSVGHTAKTVATKKKNTRATANRTKKGRSK